ncbi:hypothetical protein LTR15_008346 [Elasticomyces elasticus]|nr:hypothetical protein LTR15_008346 [Elasticomyces elasticus]
MAIVHAGLKRPYDQVRDTDRISSSPGSRDHSRFREDPRETSAVSRIRSGFNTPSNDWTETPRETTFKHDASIVLIGLNGVGKSSLGILAATAYNRRLVEVEKCFADATGCTSQTYRKLHGTNAYYSKHCQVLQSTLDAYNKNSVIVCNFSALEHDGSRIIRSYAEHHPVVHITRDAAGVQSYLQAWNMERVQQLLHASGPLLRSCANFEFFNLTEKLTAAEDPQAQDQAKRGLFLTLKRVERDFLKLLRNILGDHNRVLSHHSAYPLSEVPVHHRSFTLAAQVGIHDVVDKVVDLDGLQVGADAVEVVITSKAFLPASQQVPREEFLLQIAETYAVVRRVTIVPIILTVDRRLCGTAPDLYHALISYCLRLGPEYCTLDFGVQDPRKASLLASRGRTLFIGLLHRDIAPARGWQDISCLEVYRRANDLGCSVVKVTMPARNVGDNFALQSFLEQGERMMLEARLTAYNTGALGRMSLCYNKILTPVKTASAPTTVPRYPDALVTPKDIFAALFATFVYEPLHFFIYGANVSYSLSPAMHNAAYRACGMSHTFGTHSSDTLEDFKKLSRESNFGGAAVVQPFKTGVLPLLDGLSSHANAIGSVNTIMPVRELTEDGGIPDRLGLLAQMNRGGPVQALYGDNTDWIGVRAVLRRGLSPANTVRPQSTALVCGAGGQARSTIYALLSLGVNNIFICNRTPANARAVADHYNKQIDSHSIGLLGPATTSQCRVRILDSFMQPWPPEYRQPTMIVSSIPTQAADGSPTNFTLPDAWLCSPTGGVLVELAYRPMMTPIVKQMRAHAHKGWVMMDGFDVLPEQAFAQYELFTGRRAPRKIMRDEVLRKYREEQEHLNEARSLDPNPPAT